MTKHNSISKHVLLSLSTDTLWLFDLCIILIAVSTFVCTNEPGDSVGEAKTSLNFDQ